MVIVGESWGGTEKERQLPFMGWSGHELEAILAEAGLGETGLRRLDQLIAEKLDPRLGQFTDKCDFFLTNVVAEQPPGNNMHLFFHQTAVAKHNKWQDYKGLYPRDNVRSGIERLKAQLRAIKPDLIIGLGNYVLWALTDNCFEVAYGTDEASGWLVPRGVGEWRGSQLYVDIGMGAPVPFLPTYHPASIRQAWAWRYLIVHDLRARAKPFLEGSLRWEEPTRNFIIRPTASQVVETLHMLLEKADHHAEFNSQLPIVCDLETRSYLIACVGLAWSRLDAITIPLMCVERKEGYFNEQEEFLISTLLRRLLTHRGVFLVGQNFLYDAQYLAAQLFARVRIGFDTMLMHHLCWPGGGSAEKKSGVAGITRKGLSHLSSLYCSHHRHWKDEGKNWEPWMGEEQLWIYNSTDCVRTFEVYEELFVLIGKFNLRAQSVERMDVANELALQMMMNGCAVNQKARAAVALELADCVVEYEARIEQLVPPDVFPRKMKTKTKPGTRWPASAHQQKEIFYDILGIKPVLDKKTGNPTVGKNALPIIGNREPILRQITNDLGEMRRFDAAAEACNMRLDPDNRLRFAFNPGGTETFRWSSSENAFGGGGNGQNISKGTEDDPYAKIRLPNLRKFIVPDPGYEIIEFDLSGAESQVCAWEADDADLKAAFRSGLKIHAKNARDLYPEIAKGMTDEELKATDHQGGIYYKCKRFVHGTENGGTAKGIAAMVGVPIREVQDFQDRYFALHPKMLDWINRVERQLAESRTVHNAFGYRIMYFDRAENLVNQALAAIKQSTIAILAGKAGLRIVREFPWMMPLLQVHDSLVFQYPKYKFPYLREVKRAMHLPIPYPDPLVIPWGAAKSDISWGHCASFKEWKEWKL